MENQAIKGVLYGVGVGPGDPGLITVNALNVLRDCPVIAAVRTKGENSLALSIAERAADFSGKQIILLDFLMSRDERLLRESHLKNAMLVEEPLKNGKSVALLSLGDISLFSSFSYIAGIIEDMGYEVRREAGVTAFCAAAARLNISLTGMESPLSIFPRIDDEQSLEAALLSPGGKVFMKSGSGLKTLLAAIERLNLSEKVFIAQNCGFESELLIKGFSGEEFPGSYFTTVIVRE